MILAATGHRPHKLGHETNMNGPVSQAVRRCLREILTVRRPESVISGMALGMDIMWAEEALELAIPVTAAIPFVGQELTWPAASQRLYRELLGHPLVMTVICATGGYSNHKFLHRDRYMVDKSDELVGCWDGSSGGTRFTIMYAREVEKPIIFVRPTSVARTEWKITWPPTKAPALRIPRLP